MTFKAFSKIPKNYKPLAGKQMEAREDAVHIIRNGYKNMGQMQGMAVPSRSMNVAIPLEKLPIFSIRPPPKIMPVASVKQF